MTRKLTPLLFVMTCIFNLSPLCADVLHDAVVNGDLIEVQRLLAKGDNPNSTLYYYGKTPLHLAAEFGFNNIIKELLKQKRIKINIACAHTNHRYPLMTAVVCGHHSTVTLLLDAGADVNAVAAGCKTALHKAAELGHFVIAKILLSYGADTTLHDRQKRTAIMVAQENGWRRIAALIMSYEAGHYRKDKIIDTQEAA